MRELSHDRLHEVIGAWAPDVRFFEEVDSTNRFAAEWAAQGAPEGCVVVAEHQTQGRGRRGRSWFDVPGALLMFSIVLRPSATPERLGLIGLIAGASLAETLNDSGFVAKVKWPNDVLIKQRKVAGMLSESSSDAGAQRVVVLGIGVNVNLTAEDLPDELRETATSLRIESGQEHDRVELLAEFLRRFDPRYTGLGGSTPSDFLNFYRPLCDTIGRAVRVQRDTGEVRSVAIDVDSSGALLLDDGSRVTAGDVVHVRTDT